MKTKPLVYKTSPGSLELRLELLARELYFRSDGGVISKIIADKGEPTHVLNIKRGILSAFQLKMISKDDTINEVSGNLATKIRDCGFMSSFFVCLSTHCAAPSARYCLVDVFCLIELDKNTFVLLYGYIAIVFGSNDYYIIFIQISCTGGIKGQHNAQKHNAQCVAVSCSDTRIVLFHQKQTPKFKHP